MNTIIRTIALWGFLSLFGLGKINAQLSSNHTVSRITQDSVLFHSQMIQEGVQVNTQMITATASAAAHSGSFTVGGNTTTYYPVVFTDGGYNYNEATVLCLGRSNVHLNDSWHGSMIAMFRYHTTNWGHGSHFIDADIKQYRSAAIPFVAGWEDATRDNSTRQIIIWLRGGSTYYWHSNYSQNPNFTNGSLTVANTSYSVKTTVDTYVNSFGPTFSNNIWIAGNRPNYFAGNVGIGTTSPNHRLDVVGTVRAHEVLVNTQKGADFVFADDYHLLSLEEVERFISTNKHLPDIAPAGEMVENGVSVSEFQIQLLQKIEELTLYLIDQDKVIRELQQEIQQLKHESK